MWSLCTHHWTWKFCSVVIAKELYESDVKIENLCWREIALYLRFQMDDELLLCWTTLLEMRDVNMWLPVRVTNRGRRPVFEASGSNIDRSERYGPWIFPGGFPSEEVQRAMFSVAIGIMVARTMELHDFMIDGRIFRQKKGGSIGLDLTGVVADIFMNGWDRLLLEKMTMNDINAIVYKRYKDDVNLVLDAEGEESETEVGVERNKRVMSKIEMLANEIHKSIKVKTDCGYNHPERQERLPELDVEVWIGRGEDGC